MRAVKVDLATASGPADLVGTALELGPLDVVVNNVGAVTPRLDGFVAVTDEQWWSSLTLTFLAAVRTTRAALPGMLAAGRGTIVTVCSVNAFLPDPAVIDYCTQRPRRECHWLGLRDRRQAGQHLVTLSIDSRS